MKTKIILTGLLLVMSNLLFAQKTNGVSDSVLLSYSIVNQDLKPLKMDLFFYGQKSGKTFVCKTNEILLPNDEIYVIYTSLSTESYELPVANAPNQYYKLEFQFDDSKAAEIHPTPTETLVKFVLINHLSEPQIADIEIVNDLTLNRYSGKTNEKGEFEILLPNNSTYTINIDGSENYSKFIIPKVYFNKIEKRIQYEGNYVGKLQPSRDSALLNLRYIDLSDKPVLNEIFLIQSISTQKIYESTKTNEDGWAQVRVQIGDNFSISTKYFDNIATQEINSEPDLYVLDLEIKIISSAEWEERLKQIEKDELEREAEWDKIKQLIEENNKRLEEERVERERIFKEEQEKAEADRVRLEKELAEKQEAEKEEQERIKKEIERLNELEKIRIEEEKEARLDELKEARKIITSNNSKWGSDTVIFAVLDRNKQWKRKLFVLDVTASMYPYNKQLQYWYMLNYLEKDSTNFVLFNDGDGKALKNKKIGKTGGIYSCFDCTITKFEKNLRIARNAGNGGDGPENDLEALIYAINNSDDFNELILVADNLSLIRDFELLKDVDFPVRIILCGVDGWINEQYLNLAYKTGGSVHTIEEDYFDLSLLHNGERIKINGRNYILVNGFFFLVD
ncbi:MAG: hypothetical protein JXL97_14150 [Bacteroidales bacterium]|nr:hypothetical protein [Bacteroidales bacterium]